jgi:hypothetical protein
VCVCVCACVRACARVRMRGRGVSLYVVQRPQNTIYLASSYLACVRVVVGGGVTLWGGGTGALEIPDRCFRTYAPSSPGSLNPDP